MLSNKGNNILPALTPKIELLSARPEFIAQIGELVFKEWGYKNPDETLLSRITETTLRAQLSKLPLTLVATINDQLVGTASLIFDDLQGRPELNPWIADVYVVPNFRHRTIASQLCSEMEKIAQKLEFKTIYLFSSTAIEMYKKLEWEFYEKTIYRSEKIEIMFKHLSRVCPQFTV